jgi:hypothetical protein
MKITKKEHEYLRTLKSGAQQREFSERTAKATSKFVEELPPMQKDIELDAWLDEILKK